MKMGGKLDCIRPLHFQVSHNIFLVVLFRKLCMFLNLLFALGFQGLDCLCLNARDFARLYLSLFMKLVSLSESNFSDHPNGKCTL